MRILVISNYYPPYTLGGYEQACAVTVEWLRAQGHQVRVLTGMPPEAIAPIRREAGVVRSLRYINYEQPSYAQKWAVERHNYTCTTAQIRQFQPDIVYLWSLRLVSLAPAHAVQTWGGPQVFEMGDFWPDAYFKTGWKHRLRQQLKGCVPGLRAARLHFGPMIAVGRWMLPELQQKYNPPRTYYVPNAVPPFPRPTATREFNGPLSALFAGRLVPEKGLHLALEALAQLKRTGWVLPLRVAGHGDAEYIARCQQQADESGLEVEWLGWQDNMAA
jgi:glycosyltransferase involved in cell wall biosynthesis